MVTVVLDASAVLHHLMGEAGGQRVKTELEDMQMGHAEVFISAVNWDEVAGKTHATQGRLAAEALTKTFELSQVKLVAVDAAQAARAAMLKNELRLGYADAICVELAIRNKASLLLTADYDFRVAGALVPMEFLPTKPKP